MYTFLSQMADGTANVSHFHRLAVAFVYDQHCCVGVKWEGAKLFYETDQVKKDLRSADAVKRSLS